MNVSDVPPPPLPVASDPVYSPDNLPSAVVVGRRRGQNRRQKDRTVAEQIDAEFEAALQAAREQGLDARAALAVATLARDSSAAAVSEAAMLLPADGQVRHGLESLDRHDNTNELLAQMAGLTQHDRHELAGVHPVLVQMLLAGAVPGINNRRHPREVWKSYFTVLEQLQLFAQDDDVAVQAMLAAEQAAEEHLRRFQRLQTAGNEAALRAAKKEFTDRLRAFAANHIVDVENYLCRPAWATKRQAQQLLDFYRKDLSSQTRLWLERFACFTMESDQHVEAGQPITFELAVGSSQRLRAFIDATLASSFQPSTLRAFIGDLQNWRSVRSQMVEDCTSEAERRHGAVPAHLQRLREQYESMQKSLLSCGTYVAQLVADAAEVRQPGQQRTPIVNIDLHYHLREKVAYDLRVYAAAPTGLRKLLTDVEERLRKQAAAGDMGWKVWKENGQSEQRIINQIR